MVDDPGVLFKHAVQTGRSSGGYTGFVLMNAARGGVAFHDLIHVENRYEKAELNLLRIDS